MDWITSVLGTEKPVIAMCHLRALPGDPDYDAEAGMPWVLQQARRDLEALQGGGVDAVMFSNEFSLPYLTQVGGETVAAMARIIGQLLGEISVPFGVNVLWDPKASFDLAVATGAAFVREVFTGVYASDFGLWNSNCGETIRHQHRIQAQGVKALFNIVPEAARYLADRDVVSIAKSTVFNCLPDGLCVSGLIAGAPTDASILADVKRAVPETPLFANTGVRVETVREQLTAADGVIVGTAFKTHGAFNHFVEQSRVREFMAEVKSFRQGLHS